MNIASFFSAGTLGLLLSVSGVCLAQTQVAPNPAPTPGALPTTPGVTPTPGAQPAPIPGQPTRTHQNPGGTNQPRTPNNTQNQPDQQVAPGTRAPTNGTATGNQTNQRRQGDMTQQRRQGDQTQQRRQGDGVVQPDSVAPSNY